MMPINNEQWAEATSQFTTAFQELESLQEAYWASMTKEQQLDAFCCVMRRLTKGELEDKRSYRGVLYDTFGFGPEAYSAAQMAGYLELHNCIFKKEALRELLTDVLKTIEIDIDPTVLNEAMSKHGIWV
jgi:hypothetical protein